MPVPVPSLDPGKRPLRPLLISGTPPTSSESPRSSSSPAPDLSALLPHFASPGIPPPSARVDPTLKVQRLDPPVRLWDIWKYGWLAAGKGVSIRISRALTTYDTCLSLPCPPGLELAMDVLSHHIYGPRRKTWGIEMTIVNSLARDASSHSHLFDIVSKTMVIPIPVENRAVL